MRHATVFDWAQVKLGEECLNALFKVNASKQHVVTKLATVGRVTVTWDESGPVKLEGPWEDILKSQTIFENYLEKLKDSKIARHGNKKEISAEETSNITFKTLKENNYPKCTTPMDNPVSEKNEVYVNITLSSIELSELSPKSIQMVNSVQEDPASKNILYDYKIENKNKEGNICEKSDTRETKTSSHNAFLDTDIKINEETYKKSEKQQDILLNNCDLHIRDNKLRKFNCCKETMPLNHVNQEKPESCGSSGITSSVDEITTLQNITPLGTDNKLCLYKVEQSDSDSVVDPCKISVSDQPRRKYHKKKDYEQLAPFKFFCSLCSFKSKRESHFTRHMKLHNEVSELFECSQCNFTSIRLSHLRRHELIHSNLMLTCNLCNYRTNNQKLLVQHKRIKHSSTKVTEVKKDIFHCVHCEYQTNRYNFFLRHMKVHVTDTTSLQVYQCEQCSYKTIRKEHFVRHTNNIHKGQRPFLCHRCGKSFKRQDALKQHSSIHLIQAVVTCSECGKGCRSQAQLSQHMSVHSSDRSFLCELCGASFKTRAVQRKHMMTIHQHPKSFLCSLCSQKFSTKFALRCHVKQHSFPASMEKKPKHRDQQTNVPTFTPSSNSSMGLVTMDTVFISEPMKSQTSHRNAVTNNTSLGDKITLQLAETYETQTVEVIPAQTVVQPSSETTALVYLTGTFTPL